MLIFANQIHTTMITFKEYLEQTKATSKYLLKFCGILFSVCFSLIYLFAEALSTPFFKNLLMILICILLGNLFAVFIWLLAVSSSFTKVKKSQKFINELPRDITDYYNITMIFDKRGDTRFNYPDCKIIGYKDDYAFLLDWEKSYVLLTLLNDSELLWLKKPELDQKYKNENIELTGFGLMQKSKRKEWSQITQTELDKRIQHLIEIIKAEDPSYSKKY